VLLPASGNFQPLPPLLDTNPNAGLPMRGVLPLPPGVVISLPGVVVSLPAPPAAAGVAGVLSEVPAGVLLPLVAAAGLLLLLVGRPKLKPLPAVPGGVLAAAVTPKLNNGLAAGVLLLPPAAADDVVAAAAVTPKVKLGAGLLLVLGAVALQPPPPAAGGRPKVTGVLVPAAPPGDISGDPKPKEAAAALLLGVAPGVLLCCCCCFWLEAEGVPAAAAAAGPGEASKLPPPGLAPGVLVVAPKLRVWGVHRSLPLPPALPPPPPAAAPEGVGVAASGVSAYRSPPTGAGVRPANRVKDGGPPGVAAGAGVA
jgi:hypothetical protein